MWLKHGEKHPCPGLEFSPRDTGRRIRESESRRWFVNELRRLRQYGSWRRRGIAASSIVPALGYPATQREPVWPARLHGIRQMSRQAERCRECGCRIACRLVSVSASRQGDQAGCISSPTTPRPPEFLGSARAMFRPVSFEPAAACAQQTGCSVAG